MANDPLHGTKGYVSVSGATLLHVIRWELKETVAPYDITALASTNPTHKSFGFDAPKEIDGTIEVLADSDDVTLTCGTVLEATLFASSGQTYAISLGIVNMSHVVDRDDAQRVTYEVKGTGNLTRA